METQLRKERLRALTAILAGISGVLSIAHFIVLGLSVSLAKDLNAQYQRYISYPHNLYINLNIPFAVFLALFGAAQMAASFLTFFFNMKRVNLDKISLLTLGGAAASFAVSFLVTATAITYNRQVASYSRDYDDFPALIPFYHWLQVDALLNSMLPLPFLLFIFYRHLDVYLQSQKIVLQQIRKQLWVFALLINACAHLALVIRTYKFTQYQDEKDYTLQTFFSSYAYSLIAEMVVSLMAFIILSFHFQLFTFIRTPLFKSCLTKNQAIIVTVITALFQLGAFVIVLIKTLQIYIDRGSAGNKDCYLFADCDEEKSFEIFITFILIVSAAALGAVIIGMKGLSAIKSEEDKQRSLLSGDYQQS